MFTKTTINIPRGTVTFFVRDGVQMSSKMNDVMKMHQKIALPPVGGGILRGE
jgi:hypothetical protein